MLPRPIRSVLALAVLLPSALWGQTSAFSTGAVYTSPGLTGFATSGAQMTGMVVSWSFVGGGVASAVWGDLTGGFHGVNSGGVQVTFASAGDTFDDTAPFEAFWSVVNLSGASLASITFNGALGYTVFDCGWNVNGACNTSWVGAFEGSPGSARGQTLTTIGGSYAGSVLGSYTNMVGLGGNAPVGDLFEQLTITFGTAGLADNQTYAFLADTDNSDFRFAPPTVVPEPASMTLLATGLAGMAAARRRKRQG